MPPRRSVDLDVPATGEPEATLPANVLDFFAPPRLLFAVPPTAVLLMAERQRERATAKAVARHGRREQRTRIRTEGLQIRSPSRQSKPAEPCG